MDKPQEINLHAKGVDVVARDLQNQGYELLIMQHDPEQSPQLIVQKNGQLMFFIVRTALLPEFGDLPDDVKAGLAMHAINSNALCYFVGVGIEITPGTEHLRIATGEKALLSLEMPRLSDIEYGKQHPTRSRLDAVPNFEKLKDARVIWRATGEAAVLEMDWRFKEWRGEMVGYDAEKKRALVRFTDPNIPSHIKEFWRKQGLNEPLFGVKPEEIWLDDEEVFRLMPETLDNAMIADDFTAVDRKSVV